MTTQEMTTQALINRQGWLLVTEHFLIHNDHVTNNTRAVSYKKETPFRVVAFHLEKIETGFITRSNFGVTKVVTFFNVNFVTAFGLPFEH